LAWQDAARQSDAAQTARAYWLQKLEGAQPLALPTDAPRSDAKTYRGAQVLEGLTPDERDRLHEAARRLGLTPFMLIYGLFGATLARLSGQSQVPIAVPTAGRPPSSKAALVGYCSDIICTLCAVPEGARLSDLRERGQALPLQVVFNYQSAYISADFGDVDAQIKPRPTGYTDGEMTLNAVDVDGALALELNYNTALYEEARAKGILTAVKAALGAVAGGWDGEIVRCMV